MPSQPLIALLVGINRYRDPTQVPPLRGCRNDIEAMAQLLQQRYGASADDIRTLGDDQATHQAIKDAFRDHLIASARCWHDAGQPQPAPAFLFHFSGHGSQAPDPTGTRPNGLDETLVPHDSRTEGGYDIKDWELGQLLDELTRYTTNVTVILDCCHSGSGTRDAEDTLVAARRCPTDHRPQPPRPANAPATRALATASGWMQPDRHVLLAACRDRELANEYPVRQHVGFRLHGVLSYFLIQELATDGPSGRPRTYREVHERVRTQVNRLYQLQMPQCEGDRDRVVFGGLRPRREAFLQVVEKAGGRIWVDGGLAHQLTRGSLLWVYPPETRTLEEAGEPIVTLEVEEPGAVRSGCVVQEGQRDVPLHARVVVHQLNNGDLQRTVVLEGDHPTLASLRARLTQQDITPYVRLTPADTPADFRVSVRGDHFEVQDGSGRLLIAPIPTAGVDEVAADLCHLVRYRNALELQNQAPHAELQGAVDLKVELLDFHPDTQEPASRPIEPTAGGEVQVEVGQCIVLKVTNRSGRPLYLAVFDFSYDWSISLLYPRHHEEQALEPGATLSLGLSRQTADQLAPLLPADITEVNQVVKVFASVQPANYEVLTQGPLKLPFSVTRSVGRTGPGSPLTRLMELAMQGGQHRALGPPPAHPMDEWTTTQTEFTLVRASGEASVSRQLLGGQTTGLPGYPLHAEVPPGFAGTLRVLTDRQATRSAPEDLAGSGSPPGLAPFPEHFRPLELMPTRAVCPPGSVIEIDADATAREALSEAAPLRLHLPADGAARDEAVLAVAFDGSFFYPVGRAKAPADPVAIDWLPPPAPEEETPQRTTRGLGRTVKLYLFKVLGWPTPSLGLHRIRVVPERDQGKEPASGEERVHHLPGGEVRWRPVGQGELQAGQRVALLVHGFQAESYWMTAQLSQLFARQGAQYDHLLTFDYDSFNTRIRDNARTLAGALQAAGVSPQDGIHLDIFAHSMGALVSRYLVEVLGGDTFMDRCFLAGPPNQGTVLAEAKRLIPWLGTVLLNATGATPPSLLASWALHQVGKAAVGPDDLRPTAEVLRELNTSTSTAKVPYHILAGSYQVPDNERGVWQRLWNTFRRGLDASLEFVFDDRHDLVISLTSMQTVRQGNYPADLLHTAVVSCSHGAYFSNPQALELLARWL
jgi:hypothetical protein